MENWKSTIPWGLVTPFLVIILVEYGLSFALDFYGQRLNQQISIIEAEIKKKEENLLGGLEKNEAFRVFSQSINIVEILKSKKSLSFIINKFNQLMPKFLFVKQFEYDADKQQITVVGKILGWQDFLRFYKYVNSLKELEVEEIAPPQLDENNFVNFSMVLLLKTSFFEEQ
jgi:hypothetical protein